jgi:hypothetical protein
MNDTLEILHKINWFLKPISDVILFLFTTKTGIFILLLTLFLYFYAILYNKIKERKLLYESATDDNKLPWKDFSIILFQELNNFLSKIIANFTVIIVVIIILLSIVGLSATFSTIDTYVLNQRKIKELSLTLKNLNQRYKVAKVEILNYDAKKDSTEFKVTFFDYAKNGYLPDEQKIKMPGHRIYIVSYVMNFDYALIEQGQVANIAFPYLIYTEKLDQTEGVKLNVLDSTGVPFIFHRDTTDVYGLTYSTYNERLKDIIELMNDEEKARLAGVRSHYDSAPFFVKTLRKGQTFVIWIEQTGGLVIKQKEDW